MRGKTEMWHVVSSEPHARVLVGLKPGVSRAKLLEALDSKQLEDLFEAHFLEAGDTIFVPAGTPHTIGPGMVLCEVQEYSDLTYRVYDYGRVDARGKPRELHVEKALKVINFTAAVPRPFRPERAADEKGPGHIGYLAACRYFAVERWQLERPAKEKTNARQFELLTMAEGRGTLQCGPDHYDCLRGQTWFLPASLGAYTFSPTATLFRTYVPDLIAFEQMLVERGYSEKQRRRFIFT